MFIQCNLTILLLTLTLTGQGHAAKIIGGHEAVPHGRPYMVLLKRHMQNNRTKHCDGFLLNKDFVMTAAHCRARSYTVLLGVHNVRNTSEIQRVSVEKAFPHKDYNATDFRNDVMLLKLNPKANFSKNVKPIPLADPNNSSRPKSCIIAGWGSTRRNCKRRSPVLMEVNVTLIEDELCAKKNSYCSKGKAKPGKGDFGGPLICEDEAAYGVMSSCFKPDSCGPRICAYAKISDYRGWITLTMEHHGVLHGTT